MKYKLLRYSLLSMLVMLCGGGIFAIGQALSKANEAQVVYTLTVPTVANNSDYNEVYDVTVDDMTWSVPGNQSSDGGLRIGGKSLDRVDRVITGKSAMSAAVGKVTVNHGGTTSDKLVVNSVTMTVASDANFSQVIETVNVTPTVSKNTNGSFDFEPSAAAQWNANVYYKFTFNISNSKNSNYAFVVKSIVFYGTGEDTRSVTEMEVTNVPELTGNVGETVDVPTITVKDASGATVADATIEWSSSNADVASVSDGKISFLAAGKTTIKASFAGNDLYKSCSAEFEFTVTEPELVDPAGVMTFKFKESGTSNDDSNAKTEIADIFSQGGKYVSEVTEATKVYQGRIGRGAKLGASSAAGVLKFTLKETVKPTRITFKARYYNESEIAITVNSNKYEALTADFDEYTISYDGNTEVSEISISTPAKRAYITELVIYTAAAEEPATPVEWPEGVEGETGKINTTVTVVGMPGNIPVDGQDCQVAYLTDANEAYVKIEVSNVTVIAKGTVDADKNVTIPAGQIVGQLNGQPAAIFATDATSADPADVVFTYSETAEKISLTCAANICLSLGQVGTPMVTLSNTELYKAKEAPAAADYYVVGTMTGWEVNADYKLTRNEQAEGEEYMITMDFEANAEMKVVKSSDGTTKEAWYPEPGDNLKVNDAGTYNVYFRPNADGGDDWYCKVIYLEKQGDPALENLWIVGDADGWGTDQPNLKAMTFNTETEAFEYEVTVANESGLHFAFGDVAASDSWDDFNANHRYAARAGDDAAEVVENQPMQLQKCNGTLVINTPGVYTVSVTKDLMLSITKTGEVEPVTTDKLYIIGDMNDWDRTAMTEMTVNSAGNYEYELTTEADCYFAFATKQLTAEEAQADPNWEVFSANYRWTIAAGNTEAELDHEYELQKADGNVVLHAGQYTVIVTPDMKMIITGTPAEQPTEFEYSAVYVAGNGADKNWLNGASWDAGAEANKLTEVADDVWEITLENVAAGEGYEFKFTVDGGWNVNFGIEDPTAFAFGTEYPGVVNGANIKFSLTEASDVTMHLDMSAYDNTTKQGAKFTVTATAAGEEPVEDEGLWITWGEDDVATAGNLQARYGEEDFYLTYVDNNSKLSVDASNAFFGTADAQKKFTHRLKSGGASNSNNNMTLHIAKAGKLNVYARSGSPSATDRNLVLTQGDTELYNAVVKDADAIQVAEADLNVSAPALDEVVYKSVYPVITVEVAAGELTIGYPTGSMNFYAFQLIPDDGPITGIRNIEVTENPMFDESLPAYNLQGQRVTKSYRGVVIQNGRKFYNK